MRLRIAHTTSYRYEPPASGVIQILRMTPGSHDGQYVAEWQIDVSTDSRLDVHQDAFGNVTLGAEVWSAQNLDPAGTVSQYSADVDAAWLIGKDTQLDAGANMGLNRATPDLEIYFGISERF